MAKMRFILGVETPTGPKYVSSDAPIYSTRPCHPDELPLTDNIEEAQSWWNRSPGSAHAKLAGMLSYSVVVVSVAVESNSVIDGQTIRWTCGKKTRLIAGG
jgi:hypothetical protein